MRCQKRGVNKRCGDKFRKMVRMTLNSLGTIENQMVWSPDMYEVALKSTYNDNISAVDDFLTNGIQALQHRRNKCVDCKGHYVKKQTLFGSISWEHLGQPVNFPANPRMLRHQLAYWTYNTRMLGYKAKEVSHNPCSRIVKKTLEVKSMNCFSRKYWLITSVCGGGSMIALSCFIFWL